MRSYNLSETAARLARLRLDGNIRAVLFWIMVGLGPILALATFVVLGEMEGLGGGRSLRVILLVDFVYSMIVAGFVARRVAGMIAARRRGSLGSNLHMRLVRFFTLIALVPTVIVAVFAAITLNFGLEGWFSDRVRNVVSNSLAAAQAYEDEHRFTLQTDAQTLARFLDDQKARYQLLSGGQLRELLTRGQLQMQRALPKAYVIDGDRQLRARGERSYLFDYSPPTPEEVERARNGEIVVIQDWEHNEFRALLKLTAFADYFLYVSREVDGKILSLLDDTKETVRLYERLEADRGKMVFEFALIYMGFALAVILTAMWMGLWFAERLSRPVGRLAGAAERVGEGDLDVRVPEEEGDDEIALLGRTFNEMTRQVKGQRDALIAANEQTERRRRLFDSVLSGVTAGVIGLDGAARVEMMNAAAGAMVSLDPEAVVGQPLRVLVPEFTALFERLDSRKAAVSQAEVRLRRENRERDLLVRVAARSADDGALEGYVVSFDDVTDLVVAQRMAAWGDVARRIAHEVKNPLTPIQLSAERLRRKFGPMVGEHRESLEQYADVIVRQTNDLRRIVDEFAKFARMPAPDRKPLDLTKLLAEAVLLQESARPDIHYDLRLPDHVVLAHLDGTMINQAVTNLMKNAAEAIDDRKPEDRGDRGQIRVSLSSDAHALTIDIQDNGSGLPADPSRLFEPYVTHRAKGTGLGLPIVKKIVEEHDGKLELRPGPVFEGHVRAGAWAHIILPSALPERNWEIDQKSKTGTKLRESI